MERIEWKGFNPGKYQTEINVNDFILSNVTPYDGSADFLVGASKRTQNLPQQIKRLRQKNNLPFHKKTKMIRSEYERKTSSYFRR